MTVNKKIAAVLMAVGLAATLAACGGNETDPGSTNTPAETSFAEGTTMATLNEAGAITIGTKFDQPLFGLMGPSGTPEGFDVEIGKIIAAELGIAEADIKWEETVSQNREPFIQNGQVDIVIATYTINDTRKEVIDFAGPYYIAGQSFLVPKGNPQGITGPDKVGTNTVCTVTGSTSEKNILEYVDAAKVITLDKYSDCLEPIRTGEAQALTTDNVILAGLVSGAPDEFEVIDSTFTEEPYGIGLKKDDTEFRNFINDVLEASYKDGRWAAAWEKTAGTVLPVPEPPAVDRY
ncbi:glutamate ABC transporter substrate-binding protein [Tessaracoccus caeni]|uniref:glutamate ABC transporter substrate-binding protein n=1 Tax=Tessaracoccus caeni TaxID=3031239 RepID=UPI0023DC3D74|nr:glutamate ABC transporter substrate-binding protein [Tessaracoccus caeni]MDF1486748.1 glutamate ABC transporter substrate-binding protein [Tessaracoccus caeni]